MLDVSLLFQEVEDPRRSNATRHDLHEMLAIALLSTLCGGEGCVDMELFGRAKEAFLRRFMRLEHGIPSHDAFSNLFRMLDPDGLHDVLRRLARGWAEALGGDVVAVDGKALRRSFDDASKRSPLHLVQAFAADAKPVPGQVEVDGKSNGIPAVPELVKLLDVAGRLVTADAMHAQHETARAVLAAGGDYVLAVKGSQETLRDDVALYLDEPPATAETESHQEVGKGHGRVEERTASVCRDVQWLRDRHPDWPGLAAIGKVEAVRMPKGRAETRETRCHVMSAALSAERFGRAVRSHWSIENSLHWVLDVAMNEDGQRNRKKNGPHNLALLRRMALNLARVESSKGSMRGKLKRAGWQDDFLLDLVRAAAQLD